MKLKKVIIDSSSAILLYKTGLFNDLIEKFISTITGSVYEELTLPQYPGSEYFINKKLDNTLSIFNKDLVDNSNDEKLTHLGDGERDSILLFKQGKFDFIIIDDGKGAKYCRDKKIPYINALLVPKIFYLSKIMTEEKYLQKTEELFSIGRYSKEIVSFVYNCNYDKLQIFLP